MHTVKLDIQDSIYEHVMFLLKSLDEKGLNITEYKTDQDLKSDLYFSQRQKQLHQDIEDIERGKVELLSQKEYENETNEFFNKLKLKYAN